MADEKKVIHVLVKIYEDGNESDFDNYSGQEYQSLTDTLNMEFECEDYNFEDLEDTNYIIKVDKDFVEKYVGRKIQIYPRQYGLNPWGNDIKVEFVIMKEKEIDLHE